MRQVVMHAPGDVRVEDRKDPRIVEPTDAIIRLAATRICGSDCPCLDPRRRSRSCARDYSTWPPRSPSVGKHVTYARRRPVKIVVFGGTGYTGGNVVREAASRGHSVVAVSRFEPQQPVDGVRYETGSAQDLAAELIDDVDVVVAALSPRGDMAGRLVEVYSDLARRSAEAWARYLQIGGFSSLRAAPGAPRFADGELAEQFRQEALEGEATRVLLAEQAPAGLDWLFISPAGSYGAWAPGEPTGTYRVGGEVALFTPDGASSISGADFALAVVDEIETPRHSREHIGIAY